MLHTFYSTYIPGYQISEYVYLVLFLYMPYIKIYRTVCHNFFLRKIIVHFQNDFLFKLCHSEYMLFFPINRLSAEAKEKTHFLNWCQDTGILEVLPYHDCDLMSKDQPDYLTCLVHLQVQNILARYPVFITGEILIY